MTAPWLLLLVLGAFCKIGLFAVGGGLATVPFLFELAGGDAPWFSREAVGDMLALAQSAPGAIGVNLAACAGFHAAALPGAYTAALGLVIPSIIIIILIARALKAFQESPLVKGLFLGFRPAAAGLLSSAGLGALALALYDAEAGLLRWKECLLFAVLFTLIVTLKRHPVVYIVAAGAAGVVLSL